MASNGKRGGAHGGYAHWVSKDTYVDRPSGHIPCPHCTLDADVIDFTHTGKDSETGGEMYHVHYWCYHCNNTGIARMEKLPPGLGRNYMGPGSGLGEKND